MTNDTSEPSVWSSCSHTSHLRFSEALTASVPCSRALKQFGDSVIITRHSQLNITSSQTLTSCLSLNFCINVSLTRSAKRLCVLLRAAAAVRSDSKQLHARSLRSVSHTTQTHAWLSAVTFVYVLTLSKNNPVCLAQRKAEECRKKI